MHGFKQLIYPVSLLLFLWSANCASSDGVLEINQACAMNAGCFDGDTAGFPITITKPGSYQLTGKLDLTGEAPSVSGIVVSAPAASIDLAGFEIHGPTTCTGTGSSISCAPHDDAGNGIWIEANAHGVSVSNGIVRGFASIGVRSGDGGRGTQVTGIRAFHNRIDGIQVHENGIVSNCVVFENGQDGIDADAGSVVDGVTSFGNGLDGIEVDGPSAVVTRSTATGNGGKGFNLAAGSKFGVNTSKDNVEEDTCGDGICSERRRYYLSKNRADGSEATSACAAGFHMASIYEILDTTLLAYDTVLGFTHPDSGSGPPAGEDTGWIRTGSIADMNLNCAAYTTSSFQGFGTTLRLQRSVTPWAIGSQQCPGVPRVWCVED